MADIFNDQGYVGGQAGVLASAATALPSNYSPPSGNTGVLRVSTDSFIRIEFGSSSVAATANSRLFAPGVEYVSFSGVNPGYFSTLAPAGNANFSISCGAVFNMAPSPRHSLPQQQV